MKKKLLVRTTKRKVSTVRAVIPLKKAARPAGRCRPLRELLRPDAGPYTGAEVQLLARNGYGITSQGAKRRR